MMRDVHKKRLSIEDQVEKIRGSLNARMDEEPASWITLENGQHVPLNEAGEAIGGAGGWAKGKNFSKAKPGKSGAKQTTSKAKKSASDPDIDEDIFEPGNGEPSQSPLHSNSFIEDMLHVGDRYTIPRLLQEAEIGSTISYTDADPYDKSDVRTVTYTKTGPDVWKGKDDVGGRSYSDISSRAVADVTGGKRENAKANLSWKPGAPKKKTSRRKNKWEKETGGTWKPMTGKQLESLETGRMLACKDGGYVRVVKTKEGPHIEAGKYHLMPLTKENMRDYMWTDRVKANSPFEDDRKMRYRF